MQFRSVLLFTDARNGLLYGMAECQNSKSAGQKDGVRITLGSYVAHRGAALFLPPAATKKPREGGCLLEGRDYQMTS